MPAFRLPRSAAAALLLLSLAFASCAYAQTELPPTPNTSQGGQGGQDSNLILPTTPLPAESNATLPADSPLPSGAIPTPTLVPAYPGSEAPNVSLPLAPGTEPGTVPPGPGAVEPANATTPPVVITLPGASRKPLPDAPANFTTAYNGTGGLNATAIMGANVTNATNATVGPPGNTTLLNLNATSGDKNASGVCFDRGFYHLSCYRFNSSNTSVDDVIAAKTECLAAWAQTRASRGCNVSADLAGSNAFNCSHYFVYHFSALPCRTSYQNLERINTNCSLYQSLNLSASKGDASLKSVNYRCGGTL